MKKFSRILPINKIYSQWRSYLYTWLLLGVVTAGTACNNGIDATKTSEPANSVQAKEGDSLVLTNFADRLVIPTYQQLVGESDKLQQAIKTFVETPNDSNLKTAQAAWKATRTPWEQSEAFAFGPAESLGYDGDLDDWPVNQTDVAAVVKSKDQLNPDYVDKKLQTTQKGFHTIEYFLFGENNNRQAQELSQRELELLQLLTTNFHDTAKELEQSWVSGVDGKPAFREVFTSAGNTNNNTYPTTKAALAEVVSGIIGCIEEVGEEKIGKPIESKQNLDFESRFSHNSLNDFKNNLLSARNAYLGEFNGTKGQSVSDLVAEVDPAIDQEIKSQLQTALDALEVVPSPIETQLNDSATLEKLKTAQSKILTAYQTIQKNVMPLFEEA